MKTGTNVEYHVDKENKTLSFSRTFDAPLATVWRAWTDSSILDQWWAPKPWKARTESQEFRVGGSWLYAMVGPEGEEHRARTDYKAISPEKSYSVSDAFTDASWNASTEMPQTRWDVSFREENGATVASVRMSFDSEKDMQQLVEMGFKEGMAAAMENLDELLSKNAI